jgi:hypothetical protein
MSQATIESRPTRRDARTRTGLVMTVLAVAVAAAAFQVNTWLAPPAHVSVTFVNDTAYDVHVDGIGWAMAGDRTSYDEVLDRGGSWSFELDYAGVDAGTVELTRSQIADDQWEVTIPASAEKVLRDRGLTPQP